MELPLPSSEREENFTIEAVLEAPASAVTTQDDDWSQLQLFARLASPSGEVFDDECAPRDVDGLRRATLAAVRRLKVARDSLEHQVFTAISLFSRAPRHSLGDELLAGIRDALAAVREARDALLSGAPFPPEGAAGKRDIAGRPAPGAAADRTEPEEVRRERVLAAEFVSNHVLEFLSRIQRAVDHDLCGPRCPHRDVYDEMGRRLRPQIARALADELAWRGARGLIRPDADDPEALERYVERASLLKKHFQELLFLRTDTAYPDRRFKNWFAVAAAIAASLWAFPLGLVLTTDRMAGLGIGFTATLVLFSLMYAVKDRIKESVRGWLAERIIRGVGGRVTTLTAPARLLGQPFRLARLRESFTRRYEARPDPFNPELGAVRSVVCLRHVVRTTVTGHPRLAEKDVTALKLVIRYDLSPLFARFDDEVKQIPVLAEGGEAVRFARAPRAYRLPARLRLRYRGRVVAEDFLVVAHKLGLERLEVGVPAPARTRSAPAPVVVAAQAEAGTGVLAGAAVVAGTPVEPGAEVDVVAVAEATVAASATAPRR